MRQVGSLHEATGYAAILDRVLTRFVQKYTVRIAHLEHGGINFNFAVEDDVLPSAEHTHPRRPDRRNPIDCGGPAAERSRVGRLRENWHRESDGGERRRDRRSAGFCQEQTPILIEQFSGMECDAFHVSYLSDKIQEAVFHSQVVKTVAYLRVSTAQQDVRSQHPATYFQNTSLRSPRHSSFRRDDAS